MGGLTDRAFVEGVDGQHLLGLAHVAVKVGLLRGVRTESSTRVSHATNRRRKWAR